MKKNRWAELKIDLIKDSRIVTFKPADVALIFKEDGERPQKIDLSFLQDRPQLFGLFVKVFRMEGPKYVSKTRKVIHESLRLFWDFLNWNSENGFIITCSLEIDFLLLKQFAVWLINVRKLKINTAANRYSIITNFLQAARHLYPINFSETFAVPENVFPGSNRSPRQSKVLTQDELQAILKSAAEEVEKIQNEYIEDDVPQSPRSLIPFMIMIAARTTINPISLYEMSRNCLEPHAIDDHALYVVWTKRRSKSGIQKQLHYMKPKGGSVIELIQFVKAYTEPLVNGADETDRGRLFLYLGKKFFDATPTVIALIRSSSVSFHLKAFIRQNNLPDFQMKQIRPSVATHHYIQTGGDLRKVQSLLGHKFITTTIEYIGKEATQPLHNRVIRSAQAEMVSRVTVIPKKTKEALEELSEAFSIEDLKMIADGNYDTGWGKCKNPFKSPQPGQQQGKCCTLFFACPTCPNALFFLEDLPRVIAIRNYFLELKKSMMKAIWDVLYREKIDIVERDILGAFTEKQIADAEQKATEITDVQALMAGGVLK